ncbi:DUF742 domain-containing protein [Streptomyces sp. NPDC058612]|uniref:DUF742 domain-containing protein n=1 Tax=Streptomyces sp. NPDC058612 TaxID=3346555 RepID=UPI00365A4B9D
MGLKPDFIEAVADICSQDEADRECLMGQVRAAREQVTAAGVGKHDHPATGPGQGASAGLAVELVVVQKRSLEVSDKLMRALERAQELERERNSANYMVLLLLTMVDRLQRDITALARTRDRIRDSAQQSSLDDVRARLARSEQQRTTAEAELERARAERHKADRLAEEAAEQVRLLTDELDRLRGGGEGAGVTTDEDVAAPVPLDSEVDNDAVSIDQALAKAARHLDDSAAHLDRLAEELHLDNLPDIPVASQDVPDNPTGVPGHEPKAFSPTYLIQEAKAFHLVGGRAADLADMLATAARVQSASEIVESVRLLREAGDEECAKTLIVLAGKLQIPSDTALLIGNFNALEHHTDGYVLLESVACRAQTHEVATTVLLLRDSGNDADAYQLLAAAGRSRMARDLLDLINISSPADVQWMLAAAEQDRPLAEIPALIQELQDAALTAAASQLFLSYQGRLPTLPKRLSRDGTHMPRPAISDQPHHAHLFEDDGDDGEVVSFRSYESDLQSVGNVPVGSVEDQPLVRPYSITRGLTRARKILPDATKVIAADGVNVWSLLSEEKKIYKTCQDAHSVFQISQKINLPLGVVRIIIAELLHRKILLVHDSVVGQD